jgi:hypothetical protein
VEDGAFAPFVVFIERMNDKSFEDHERTLEEIKFYFSTSYIFMFVGGLQVALGLLLCERWCFHAFVVSIKRKE